MTATPPDEPPAAPPGFVRRYVVRALPFCVVLLLSAVVIRPYVKNYSPQFGWTKTICFGPFFAKTSLPRLQRTPHYTEDGPDASYGYDGQFYAQMALDPSLQDPAFDHALDTPAYRARRIGLPAVAFCLGAGKRAWVLQAYALSNLLFWFVLLGALCWLLKPRTGRELLCLSAGMWCYGAFASMERSLVDLPAAAMLFMGLVVGSWGRYGLLAASILTRETNLLATAGFLDLGRSWRAGGWKRSLIPLALAVVPFALWMAYVHHRFGHLDHSAGERNFAFPLQTMCAVFSHSIQQCFQEGFRQIFAYWWQFDWLYLNRDLHDALTIAAFWFQGLYLLVRWEVRSPLWRMGVCYLALAVVLGPAVWEDPSAAARVLLPLTLCFYLRLAREHVGWFWPFFLLGSLSLPYGLHEFWLWT